MRIYPTWATGHSARLNHTTTMNISPIKAEAKINQVVTAWETLRPEKSFHLLVNAVKGDPTEGEDGVFYEALGYVRKSERRSGLSRSKKLAAPVAA